MIKLFFYIDFFQCDKSFFYNDLTEKKIMMR